MLEVAAKVVSDEGQLLEEEEELLGPLTLDLKPLGSQMEGQWKVG